MPTNDLEAFNKAIIRTLNERENADNSVRALAFTIGDKVSWKRGRYGEIIRGIIVKKNRSRANIRVTDGLGTAMWTVPYSMLTLTNAGSETDAERS